MGSTSGIQTGGVEGCRLRPVRDGHQISVLAVLSGLVRSTESECWPQPPAAIWLVWLVWRREQIS